VPLGFACAVVFILLAKPDKLSLAVGGAVALIGLMVRAWASGHIRKNSALAVSGPYAHTRNPLYLGSFILGLGFTVAASSSLWLLLILGGLFAALFLGIYLPVMRVESLTLAELFGEDYRRYASAVPLFFPRLTPYKPDEGAAATKFDPDFYLRYRVDWGALGLLLAWGVLWLKAVLAF
jgi:protein-S-isoprenylcysteine O-methyltransferase Ste14